MLKSSSSAGAMEYTVLQTDLLEEKRRHLETTKELAACTLKLRELEGFVVYALVHIAIVLPFVYAMCCRLIDTRLSEAIGELNDKQTLIDDLTKVGRERNKSIQPPSNNVARRVSKRRVRTTWVCSQ